MPLFNKEILYRYKTHPFPNLNIIASVSFCTYIHTYLHSNAAVKKADDVKVTKWIHKLNYYQQNIRKGHVVPTWQNALWDRVIKYSAIYHVCVCAHIQAHKPHSFLLCRVSSCVFHFPSRSRMHVRAQRKPCPTAWDFFLTCRSVHQYLLWTFNGRLRYP